jgi:hypothetical protein
LSSFTHALRDLISQYFYWTGWNPREILLLLLLTRVIIIEFVSWKCLLLLYNLCTRCSFF